METKRNKRMMVVATIFTLLVVIGASYAYFTGGIKKEGDTTTTVETASLVSATAKFGGTIEANGALPGYKVVKTINIKGGGSSNSKPISGYIILTPDVVDFSNHVKYYIYEVEGDNPIDIADICEESKNTNTNNQYYDDMKCDTSSLGTVIAQGTFSNRNKVTKEITIEYNTNKTYYILVEYVNDTENPQDEEQGKKFTINIDADTEIKETVVEHVMNLASSSDEVVYDETEDNNIRYIGANPNNYVLFNNELWRIIGLMNNIEDENGKVESRIKLIRNESIGNYAVGNNSGGLFDWSSISLQNMLNNGDYYNKTGIYINDGLNDEAKEMISSVVWNIGIITSMNMIAKDFYNAEREETVYNDIPILWIGQVALMYPSDYGYATDGGSLSRSQCLEYSLLNWHNYRECYNNDWLYKNLEQRLLPPYTSYSLVVQDGRIYERENVSPQAVRPVIYLNTNLVIQDGTGAIDDPFILQMQ